EPAACGTMILIGRFGKSAADCAVAPATNASIAALVSTANSMGLFIGALPSRFLSCGKPIEGGHQRQFYFPGCGTSMLASSRSTMAWKLGHGASRSDWLRTTIELPA